MAILDDLIMKVEDPVLRDRLKKEVHKATKNKQFGLVFEEHLPECTPLYDVSIKRGSRVAPRDTEIKVTYTVMAIDGDDAICISNDDKSEHTFKLDDIVVVAEFGEPIYPYLQTVDTVCNAPDSDLWHTLIEADNYHALQLLEYMYAGKVDCIYIDPPYNKEDSRDWKYNCNYVDGNDLYRHSKWLSMMERRLKLAKKLLNPNNSVLIIAVDELEYLHLGMLLEQMFKEARIQMISTCINPGGVSRGAFRRVDEYYYFVMFGASAPQAMLLGNEWYGGELSKHVKKMNWRSFCRSGSNSMRSDRPNLFYPIFVYKDKPKVHSIGDTYYGDNRKDIAAPPGTIAVWPLHSDSSEGYWMYTQNGLETLIEKGYFHVGGKTKNGYALYYLNSGEQKKVETGVFTIIGKNKIDGSIITDQTDSKQNGVAPTQWRIPSHNARTGGTEILKKIIPGRSFDYPKSVYAVHDVLKFFVINNPNAIIIDFFAGSGTTLHAVNLLNAEDGGRRKCVMVTNNEIGEKEEKKMKAAGYRPGDPEWEAIGIAKYVTWPRTVCSIEGHNVNGNPLKGDYIGYGEPMSDGFKANAIYFKLGFLNKNAVALGRQFKELLSVLWMKAGAIGPCPHLAKNATVPDMMILPENKMAILVNEIAFADFANEMQKHPEINTVYIVTDSDRGYREMAASLSVEHTYQLYRDYLDNFRINHRR